MLSWLPKQRQMAVQERAHQAASFSARLEHLRGFASGLEKWLPASGMIAGAKERISFLRDRARAGCHSEDCMVHAAQGFVLPSNGSLLKLGGGGGGSSGRELYRGKSRNMHKNVRARRSPRPAVADKAMAFGISGARGQIRTMVLPDRQSKTVHPGD